MKTPRSLHFKGWGEVLEEGSCSNIKPNKYLNLMNHEEQRDRTRAYNKQYVYSFCLEQTIIAGSFACIYWSFLGVNRVIHISISPCDRLCLPAFDWTSSWGTFPKMIENRTWFWVIHERLSRLVILLLSNFLNHHLLLYANSICTSSDPEHDFVFQPVVFFAPEKNIATNNPRPFNQTFRGVDDIFLCLRKVDIPSHSWKTNSWFN